MKIFQGYRHDSKPPLIKKIKEFFSKRVEGRLRQNVHKVIIYITVVFSLMVSQIAFAQIQEGFVKTIGRPDKPGVPLANVIIQMVGMANPAKSSATGEFKLSAYNKKDGDAIKLLRVQKNGYELKDKGMIGRSLVFSSHVPIYSDGGYSAVRS